MGVYHVMAVDFLKQEQKTNVLYFFIQTLSVVVYMLYLHKASVVRLIAVISGACHVLIVTVIVNFMSSTSTIYIQMYVVVFIVVYKIHLGQFFYIFNLIFLFFLLVFLLYCSLYHVEVLLLTFFCFLEFVVDVVFSL